MSDPTMPGEMEDHQQGIFFSTEDPEKFELMQLSMVVLLHADKCQRKERKFDDRAWDCFLPYCSVMKNVIKHMLTCEADQCCPEPLCVSSWQITRHIRNCMWDDCLVCSPVVFSNKNRRSANFAAPMVPQPTTIPDLDPINMTSILMQQQLVILLHAYKCQSPESQPNDVTWRCFMPLCRIMKNVISHMQTCSANNSCAIPYCSSSKRIISHFKQCTIADCPLCSFLKPADENSYPANSATPMVPQQNIIPDLSPFHMGRADEVMDFQNPTIAPNALTGQGACGSNDRSILGERREIPAQNLSLPFSNNSTPVAETDTADTLATAMLIQETTEWHQSMTPELRNNIVHKLIPAMFPNPGPRPLLKAGINKLLALARKIEGDSFEIANSRSEYYELMAKEIVKIHNVVRMRQKHRVRAEEIQKLEENQKKQSQQPFVSGAGFQKASPFVVLSETIQRNIMHCNGMHLILQDYRQPEPECRDEQVLDVRIQHLEELDFEVKDGVTYANLDEVNPEEAQILSNYIKQLQDSPF